jgi:hypothetical protein
MQYIRFITKNNQTVNMRVGYDDKLILNFSHTKFLRINIDGTFSWRTRIEQLISRLSTAFYVIRSIKPYTSHTTLIMLYYSFFFLL